MPASLIDEATANPIAIAEAPASDKPRRPCPACQASLAPDAVVCTQCGYDTRKGFQAGTGIGADVRKGGITKCRKCGYSLKGLKTNVCPECGTRAVPQSETERRKDAARQGLIEAYRTPILMFLIGSAITLICLGIYSKNHGLDFQIMAGRYLVDYLISVPAALIAYFIAGAVWMGFNSPLHIIGLQFAGIFAVTSAVSVVLLLIIPLPLVIISWAILLLVYFGLLQQVMELDFESAIVVVIIMMGTDYSVREFAGPPIYEFFGLA